MTTRTQNRWLRWTLRCAQHVAGVLVILSIQALCFVNDHVVEALQRAVYDAYFYELVAVPVLIEIGLAICLWALLVIMFEWVRETVKERRGVMKVALKKSAGTVLTETLIILPIFLLLTSGLAQLAINSSASILMSVATFQAGRTAWLWEPETRADNARNGMSGRQGDVEEHARVAAASVLAPVVPAEFGGTCQVRAGSRFGQRLRAFGFPTGSVAGVAGPSAVRALTSGQASGGEHSNFFYNVAYDTSAFSERGAKKFYLAYCLTSATYEVNGGFVTTTVTYNHKNVFPWFAYIFGVRKMAGGSMGYYSEYEMEYFLPEQIDANPINPLSLESTFKDILSKVWP